MQPTLDAVVETARRVTGHDVGVALIENGALRPAATTAAAPHDLDVLQAERRDGPCLDAATSQSTVRVDHVPARKGPLCDESHLAIRLRAQLAGTTRRCAGETSRPGQVSAPRTAAQAETATCLVGPRCERLCRCETGGMAKAAAQEVARWRADDAVFVDHTSLDERDLPWLEPAKRLTLWAVKVPQGLLAQLPALQLVDMRGGSASSVDVLQGCVNLRCVAVNQVRGCRDLDTLTELVGLERLDLYGLPQVTAIPSLSTLTALDHLSVGSMKGLTGLTGVLDAPHLRELSLAKYVGLAPGDADAIAAHPSIERFSWYAEDIPLSMWRPVVERVRKDGVTPTRIETWLDQHPR